MFLFKNHKQLSHQQCASIGFVLAVISILVTVVMAYGVPVFGTFLNGAGIYHLDLFLFMTGAVIFMALQGLLLFGFPLYYVKDKKSHMTGFQILLYALMWVALLVLLVSALALALA